VDSAIVELRKKDPEDSYHALNEGWSSNPGAFENVALGMGSFTISYYSQDSEEEAIRYGLMDEIGKININLASAKVLTNLLSLVAELDEQKALSLTYCIIDWRDADSFFQHPQYGAEDDNYKGLNSPYESKDAQFEVIEELLLVKGISQDIFERIKDFITVYGYGQVNINTASRQVLLALGLSPDLITKILKFRSGEDLISGSFDDNVFSSVSGIVPDLTAGDLLNSAEVEAMTNFVSSNIFVTKSSDFMVKCVAGLNNKKEKSEVTAVVNQDGLIRYWRNKYY
jgi:hypothetical protein